MENTQNHNEVEIKFNIDEFDLENYEFKALNEGLGFHGDEKQAIQPTPSFIEEPKVERPVVARTQQKPVERKTMVMEEMALPSSITAMATKSADANRTNTNKVVKKIKLATEADRFSAFFIDTAIVALMTLTFYTLSLSITGLSLDQIFTEASLKWSAPFLATMFCFFFLMYFSLLDSFGTFGKRQLNIILRKTNDKEISSSDCLVRALITLLSIPLCFFPIVLDFQGKLSDTQVVVNK